MLLFSKLPFSGDELYSLLTKIAIILRHIGFHIRVEIKTKFDIFLYKYWDLAQRTVQERYRIDTVVILDV